MKNDEKKIKKAAELLSERVDALEVSLLMILNSLSNTKTFEMNNEKYNVIGMIPETTLKLIEKIIIK